MLEFNKQVKTRESGKVQEVSVSNYVPKLPYCTCQYITNDV
jgi:hypothetical protein